MCWFRTDWQRGGALTGYATFQADQADPQAVVVKLPIGPTERDWLLKLQPYPDVVPRVYAHGQALGGYDFAWVAMERLPHGPLSNAWRGYEFDLLVEVATRFHAAAQPFAANRPAPTKDWSALLQRARANVQRHSLANEQRWNQALKKAQRHLNTWLDIWGTRATDQWCHGDLHLANAMTRAAAPQGPAVLLDLSLVHPGHWLEDAVYFEHLYWASPDKPQNGSISRLFARERKRQGLAVEPDWPRLASVARALQAMITPALLQHDGVPNHVLAALEVLEREVG